MAHYHIFLFGGQSNMQGYGSYAALEETPSVLSPFRTYSLDDVGTCLYMFNSPTLPTDWTQFPTPNDAYGPETAFLAKWRDEHPTEHLAVVKAVAVGTSIEQ